VSESPLPPALNGKRHRGEPLSVCGLFAGIGGIEEGLRIAGHEVRVLCEIDPAARNVLKARFSRTRIAGDVTSLSTLPRTDIISAGFPCQDLSQAGKTNGIDGPKSSVVATLFALVAASRYKPKWVILENVPFMLRLDKGRAMHFLTKHLESLGYMWAYRLIDSRAFGLPQRRLRVILLASMREDPRSVLFSDDAAARSSKRCNGPSAYGFYWTEGNNGLGWAEDAVPTLKGGSSFGIPCPPGIWVCKDRSIVTPDVRDAERLQGFPADWTATTEDLPLSRRARWRLVGNAVSVPVTAWLGGRLAEPGCFDVSSASKLSADAPWPTACWGEKGKRFAVAVSSWPVRKKRRKLLDFLRFPTRLLSARATSGFLCRARESTLNFVDGFLDDVAHHLRVIDPDGKYPERFTNGRAKK